jgi:cyclophilin family peptidyl-prolyl cis-trans isomerase
MRSLPIAIHMVALFVAAAILPAQNEEKQDAQDPTKKVAVKQLPNPKVVLKTTMGNVTLELFVNEAPKTVANFIGLAEGTKEFTDAKTKKKIKKNYFDGLIFHRVIPDFMAQGGCPLGTGTGDPGFRFEDEINAKALGLDKKMAWVETAKGKMPSPLLGIRTQDQIQQAFMAPMIKRFGIKSQKDLEAKKKEIDAAMAKLTFMDVFVNMGYKYDDSRASHGMKRGTIAMANSGPNTNGSQFFINMKDNTYLNGKHTVFGAVLTGMDVIDKMQKVEMKEPSKPKVDIKILSIRKVADVKK